ncbi:MAG: hypothetical protein UT57_C0007G0001, partial [Microgenomates group bacterium GW2011_GWC1_39_7]
KDYKNNSNLDCRYTQNVAPESAKKEKNDNSSYEKSQSGGSN